MNRLRPSPSPATPAIVFALLCAGAPAQAEEFRIKEVASILDRSALALKPNTVAFSDYRSVKPTDEKADKNKKKKGLVRFKDWAKAKPLQKEFLSPYPGYEEPTLRSTSGGRTKTYKRRLHIYAAEARFELERPPGAIDLARYTNLDFLKRMDPAVEHQLITAADVTPNTDHKLANRNPGRRWCENTTPTICIKSRYKLEGKLPTAILLLNKLRESGRKIADFIEFESELRVVPTDEIDQAGLTQLTGIDTPVVAVLEQNIIHVNQVMQFGKFLAVLQAKPTDPNRTLVTAFVSLAVESGLFEKRKEFEGVPVLRNLLPAKVLSGGSSFNTGNSISAGLPNYARNRIKAMASILSE